MAPKRGGLEILHRRLLTSLSTVHPQADEIAVEPKGNADFDHFRVGQVSCFEALDWNFLCMRLFRFFSH